MLSVYHLPPSRVPGVSPNLLKTLTTLAEAGTVPLGLVAAPAPALSDNSDCVLAESADVKNSLARGGGRHPVRGQFCSGVGGWSEKGVGDAPSDAPGRGDAPSSPHSATVTASSPGPSSNVASVEYI